MYLDTAASIFVVIGMDRKVQLVNQKGCEVLGYEEDEIVGEDWFDKFIPEKDRVQVLDVFNKIVDGTMERVEYFENSILCKNEEQRRIEWHNTAIKDEVGFTTATLSSGVDITERTQIEEAKVRAMLEGEENEKKRVAKELHDGLGQTLSALSLHINSLEEYYEQFSDKEKKSFMNTKSLVENAINEVKYISRNIMPRPLEDYGLAKGIEYLCDILNQTGKVKVSFGAHGLKSRFDPKIEVALYRMTQELLNNSIKYADTDEVSVQLIQHENSILLMVEDEGSGFDLTRSRIKSHGLGLKNIQTRTRSLGGTLLLDSTPGEGTSVTIEIPLNN